MTLIIGGSPAAAAQAGYDQMMEAAQFRNPPMAERLAPQAAAAIANDPRARAIAEVVNQQPGPFGQLVPAEVLRRSDVLFSQIELLADGTPVVPATANWWRAAPDNVVQSEEVVANTIDGQVDFEIRSLAIHVPLGLGIDNWDFLKENATFEFTSTDQNLVRVPLMGNILQAQASFDTALSGFAAPGTERTLITGVSATGFDLPPSQFKLWRRTQTLQMFLRLIGGFTFPVALGAPGFTVTFGLLLFGRKQTDLKS